MKKIIGIALVIVLAGIGYYFYQQEDNVKGTVEVTGTLYDIIGTNVGTTTTGVYFADTAASSSYPFIISTEVDTATLYLQATNASSTGAEFTFSIFGSNDYDCDTASTTAGTLNNVIVSDIDWYDMGSLNLNTDGSLAISSATTTYAWHSQLTSPKKTITLTNLNTRCLKLEVHGSSTVMYVGVVTKSHKGGF